MDFRARVAEHYRQRGYDVRESVRVRGSSGGIHAADMVAQGPLGSMVVTFGGTDGVDETDLAQVKRLARDIGATPVAAAAAFDPVVRRAAAREQIVLVDGDLPEAEPEVPAWAQARAPGDDWETLHPWPDTGRAGDPAKTALRSVALDDLLSDGGAADAGPDEAPGPAAETVQAGSDGEVLAPASAHGAGGKAGGAGAAMAGENGAATERFAWLGVRDRAPQGGYEFADAHPAPRAPAVDERNRILDDVRARIDRVTGASGTQPAAEVRSMVEARARSRLSLADEWPWLLRFTVAGVVAGLVVVAAWRLWP